MLEAQTHLPALFTGAEDCGDPSGAQSLSPSYSLRQRAAAGAPSAAVLLLYLHPHVVQQDFKRDLYTSFKQAGIAEDILDWKVTLGSCKATQWLVFPTTRGTLVYEL